MWRARRLFVEIAPDTMGLVHISEIELDRHLAVIQEWDAGDSIDVKVISVRAPPDSLAASSLHLLGLELLSQTPRRDAALHLVRGTAQGDE